MFMQSMLAGGTAALLMLAASAQAATAPPAAGGANQRTSVEGCAGTWLFNGVWRVRVVSIDSSATYNDGSAQTGTGVKFQVRNGTSKPLEPMATGFADPTGRGIDLAYADDNTVNVVGAGTDLGTQLTFKKMPPGGGASLILYFPYSPDKGAKPKTLLVNVDPTKNRSTARYTVKAPSFRVHLDCGTTS